MAVGANRGNRCDVIGGGGDVIVVQSSINRRGWRAGKRRF